MAAALADAADRKLLTAGIPARRFEDGRRTVTQVLCDAAGQHQHLQAQRLERLIELASLLNAAGMEPILLKGGRALWTGAPAWRTMGDLDLLVFGGAAEAQALAMNAGYAPMPGYDHPDAWHHEINLYRDDLPGWLEFHGRAAMHCADILLTTESLVAESRADSRHGAVVRLLPPAIDLLHGVIHHHIADRGDKFGTISTKRLYEFAAGFARLGQGGRATLNDLTAAHPRLVAILDLWLAAAQERFALRVEPPFAVHAEARARWRAMVRSPARGYYGGVLGELQMSLSGRMLRRAAGGDSWFGRLRLRRKVISSLLSRPVKRA